MLSLFQMNWEWVSFPVYPLGRYFREIAGKMNQKIAEIADEVYFVVSGIPMKIK